MHFSFRSILNRELFVVSVCIALSAVLSGCATPTTSAGMTPTAIKTTTKHAKTVSVAVAGGQETDSMGKPKVSNSVMAQAITDSINASKTFSGVVQGKSGDYMLSVNIANLDQPSFGASFTVKLEAGWTLQRVDTGAVVWQESVKAEHTATMGDALVAVERLRLATEGAARDNIAVGLEKISALKL